MPELSPLCGADMGTSGKDHLRKSPVGPRRGLVRESDTRSQPRRYFSRSHGIVSPCTTTANTTTPKAVIRISSWSGKEGGSARANANASAPRSPPHQRTCCSRMGIAHVENRNGGHIGYTVRARPARTNPIASRMALAPTLVGGMAATLRPIKRKIREFAMNAPNSHRAMMATTLITTATGI
jgi:hypothetical protein